MRNPIDSVREKIQGVYEKSKQAGGSSPELFEALYQELMTVLEEVEVYEEELAAQNSELEAQRHEVERQRLRYEDLFHFAPEAYLVTDLNGVVREANRMASTLLNTEQRYLIGKPLITFIEENNRKRFRLLLSTSQGTSDFDIPIEPRKLSRLDVSVRMAFVMDERGKPFEIRWVLHDVTESKRLQQAVRKSEERLMRVFTGAPILIVLLNERGIVVESNKALLDQLHYRSQEVIRQPVDRLVYDEDLPVFKEQMDNVTSYRSDNERFEVRFLDWNQNLHWMRVSLTRLNPIEEDNGSILMMTDDITAERQIEQERLEIRRQVMEGIENERVRLAQDLHDHPLQDLYGALFELIEAADDLPETENRDKLERVQESIQQTIDSLRATCGELRPPSLRFYGLEKAIRYYIELIKPRTPNIDFQLDLEKDENRLPPILALALYRIVQQGVANVVRHAMASQASISMHFNNGMLTLKIEDNGVGFEVPDKVAELAREGHYGLAGITERVESIGGELQIDSRPDYGTTLEIDVPVENIT